MSIEDLVYLSQDTNGGETYREKYVELGRTLNFKSEISYCNYDTREYNEFLGISDDIGLMEALTNTKYEGFKPIGTFTGTFDGKGYVLKNLYEHNTENAGLFKLLEWRTYRASVKNLEITGEIMCEGDNVGSISASYGNIDNCISRVNITASGDAIGGIVGSGGGTVTNCSNYGVIIGGTSVGGISGNFNGKLRKCQNFGTIKGIERVGGICGINWTFVDICSNYNNVMGENVVGGIGGSVSEARNCFNYKNVEGITQAGGLFGQLTSCNPIMNCFNLGEIKARDNVGGIAGDVWFTQTNNSKIINCYSIGELEGQNKGGIVGKKTGYGAHYIENCYWPKEFNIDACSNKSYTVGGQNCIIEINEETTSYDKTFMQSQDFVNILNNYVTTYNEEHKEDEDFVELLTWELDSETKYPKLNLNNE